MVFSQKDHGIILGKTYGIYWAKTTGYIMGYIRKTYGILGKTSGIYYGIYWLQIVGYICQNYAI